MRIASLFLLLLCSSAFAQHTFSIVAIDAATGEIGSAGATCLRGDIFTRGAMIISQLAPGKGAINAQATVCIPNSNAENGRDNLLKGLDAKAVLAELLLKDACSSGDTSTRQYGIVSIDEKKNITVASYTGKGCMAYANHITGENYSIQGNILLGKKVLDSIETRFKRARGTLAMRLMQALQGANMVGADSRCAPDGTSSKSAFVRVAKPGDEPDAPSFELAVWDMDDNIEPIDSLQHLFNETVVSAPQEYQATPLLLYPNPATHAITLRFGVLPTENTSLRILDLLGNTMMALDAKAEYETTIPLLQLPAGFYRLGIYHNNSPTAMLKFSKY